MKNQQVYATMIAGLLLVSCQESRVQPSAPSELKSDNLVPSSSSGNTATDEGDEKVTPPGQITGAYLGATVLKQSNSAVNNVNVAETQLGVVIYFKGKKVLDDPSRYRVTLTISYNGGDPDVQTQHAPSTNSSYNEIVTITSSTQKKISSSYGSTGVYLTITDNSDYSTDTINTNLATVLSNGTASSNGGSATAGQAGTDGTATQGNSTNGTVINQ